MVEEHDVIVVGAGLAGLRAALEVADRARVVVVSKVLPTRSHSGAAQGGVAAALGNEGEDRTEWHMYDTVKGGDFLSDQDAVELFVADAPRAVYELEHMGVPFSRTADGRVAQRAFGGHTRDFGVAPVKRACFASDRTGRVILDTLYEQAVKRGIRFLDEHQVIDLDVGPTGVAGVAVMDLATGAVRELHPRALVLATGGFGRLFATTSNCHGNAGECLAMLLRCGLPLQDLEFVQFHPTGIRGLGILISEAVRGEGGVLRNGLGERFMERYAPSIKDLAPRDIVARAILEEVLAGRGVEGGDHVHLDLTHLGPELIERRLPEIASFARIFAGVDPVRTPIPVLPTCHYMMGGIPTDLDGRVVAAADGSTVPGLFAAGECACVSLHGANRLGCNSLLDLVVFGRRAGKAAAAWLAEGGGPAGGAAPGRGRDRLEMLRGARGRERVGVIRAAMQAAMGKDCSVFRTDAGLARAGREVDELRRRFEGIGLAEGPHAFDVQVVEALEAEAMLDLARAMVTSARFRAESRGAHFRRDFPERDDARFLVHSLVRQDENGHLSVATRPVRVTRFEPVARTY